MQGIIEANFTTMPKENIIVMFVGIAGLIILITVVIFFLVKKLGVRNIGSIQLEHRGLSTEHSMNNETKDADDACRRQMRQITDNIKIHISNIFAGMAICPIARLTISSVILKPLFASVGNNHFTTELMPERYEAYRVRIFEMIKDEYVALASFSKEVQCAREALPSWEIMKDQFSECVNVWLKRISREVMQCCEKKILVYRKYLAQFLAAKDEYRAGIVREVIEKNDKYIVVLKTRI